MIVHDVEQRSDAWRALRSGRLTSSTANDMLATRQDGKPAAGRTNLRVRLVLERITGRSQEKSFQSQAMLDGIEREQQAVEAYEVLTGKLLRSVGFVSHDSLMAGYSPDGVIGDFDGLIEAKCPIPATHFEFLTTGKIALDYQRQITHALWMTGANWCDFVSYQPEFPEPLQLKVVRVLRDAKAVAEYGAKAEAFLAEVDRECASVKTMLNLPATLSAAAAVA